MISVADLLAISQIPHLGPNRIRTLISYFKGTEELLGSSARRLTEVNGFNRKLASAVARDMQPHRMKEARAFAARQLSRLNAVGGKIVTYWDPDYPELLKKIYDPPPHFFMLGSCCASDVHAIGIVGTRSPSEYGVAMTEYFARELVNAGICVVSGLARGIDTVAHTCVLNARGRTIAVTGSGLDVIYPPENRPLYMRIPSRGAIISEFFMGTKPDAVNFPRRNRLISGLTLGCIVIETDCSGGAMITASTALDQNREVFALPGNATSRRSRGCHALIKDGRAKLVETVDDVLSEFAHRLRPPAGQSPQRRTPDVETTLFEEKILEILGDETLHIDAIARRSASAVADTLVTLLSLEFKGLVRQLSGKRFLRK